MFRRQAVYAVEVEWTLVSVKGPCTICGGHDSCRRGSGDEFACCTRISSEWPLTVGGWVHRLDLEAERRLASTASHVDRSDHRTAEIGGVVMRLVR